jgi:hypothetical protein
MSRKRAVKVFMIGWLVILDISKHLMLLMTILNGKSQPIMPFFDKSPILWSVLNYYLIISFAIRLDISHSSDEVALVFTQLHHFLTLS